MSNHIFSQEPEEESKNALTLKIYTVFGCSHRQSNIAHPSFHPIIMDVTNEESVKNGLEEVSKGVSSLRAVVNVSGVMFMGSLIEEGEGILNQILDGNRKSKQIILSSC